MSKELKELLEQKEVVRGKIAQCQNEEELAALKAEMEELDKKEKFIAERAAYLEEINKGAGTPVPAPGKVTEPVDKFDTMEYRKAFMDYVLSGGKNQKALEYRADQVTMTTDVGAVIPTTVINSIIKKLEATGMILAEVTRTALRGGVTYPVSTVKPVATWVAEGQGSDTQIQPVGSITFAYHKLRCAVAVTLEVDIMAISAFENLIVSNIAEAMLKAVEQAIVSGNGQGKPKGIVTETPAETITVAGALTYANVISAEGALPLAYEAGAVYVMAKKTFTAFAGQVDQTGQPIARVDQGVTGKLERTILGRRVILTDYLPALNTSTDASTVVGFLFNMKDYVLNTNYKMGLKKYEDNETDDQIMKAIMLVDGKVVDASSLVVFKTAAATTTTTE